jgi:hypothetical protein
MSKNKKHLIEQYSLFHETNDCFPKWNGYHTIPMSPLRSEKLLFLPQKQVKQPVTVGNS